MENIIKKRIDKAERSIIELDDFLRGLRVGGQESKLTWNVRRSIIRLQEDIYQLRRFKNENN